MKTERMKKLIIICITITLSLLFVMVGNLIRNERGSKSGNYPGDLNLTFYSYGMAAIPDDGHEYITKIVISPYTGNLSDSYVEINRDGFFANGDNTTYVRVPIQK